MESEQTLSDLLIANAAKDAERYVAQLARIINRSIPPNPAKTIQRINFGYSEESC